MKESNGKLEGIIKYDDYEKKISFPKNYDDLLDTIISLFHISTDKKPLLLISFKNISGDSIKIFSSEVYSYFLLKISQSEISNILYVSIEQSIKNKIRPYGEDIYDRDEEEVYENNNNLKQGHIFSKNKINQSDILRDGGFGINKILNESIEGDLNNNKNDHEIGKSVLSPIVSFPCHCNMCQKFPLIRIMYYCSDCKLNLCEDCERFLGYNHRHCYFIIRNKDQYQDILKMELKKDEIKKNKIEKDINIKDNMEQLSKNIKEGASGIFNSFIGFIKG